MRPWLQTILAGLILLSFEAESARILGLFPFPASSHASMTNTVMRELASRGHEVTIVTNFPERKPLPNYKEIIISPTFDFWSVVMRELNMPGIFELHDMTFAQMLKMLFTIGISTTEYALQHPNVQRLIHSTDQQFDLIIGEQFFQEAFLMFSHKFKVPYIQIGTFGFAMYMNEMMGNFGAWSHVPHEYLPYNDHMTFIESINNIYFILYEMAQRNIVYLPQQQALADKYFAHLPGPKPSVQQLTRNVSALLLNSYAPISSPRPTVPGLIEVGGLHIGDVKPLPDDIKRFLDGATDGAIFFSLGSNLKSSDMPAKQLRAFLQTFASMSKLRILWKWEDDDTSQLPKNVLVKKWMPQNDILAHPNVKVFITHGGLLGTQEGVHHGVPMLGVPIYADQHLNMHKANMAGYAISLQFNNVTETSLRWALNELINNPRYSDTVKLTSQIFRDRSQKPLDEAIYWVEYVIRYGGASHLRSAGLDLSWFSYFLLDVIGIAIVGLWFLWMVVKKLLRGGKKMICKGEPSLGREGGKTKRN